MQFAVADIKVCANGTVDDDGYGFDASNFQLTDRDDRTYEFWNVPVGARSPNLTDSVSSLDTPRRLVSLIIEVLRPGNVFVA
jgi:hypothetical protein